MDVDYKVPAGKLIRISAEIEDGKIRKLQLSGDFFVHPEESISALEKALIGSPLERQVLQRICYRELSHCVLIGMSPRDVVHPLLMLQSDSS